MIERMLAKGNRCLRAALYEEACVYYTRSVALMPHLPYATFNMGIARLRQGRLEEGLGHIQDATRQDPGLQHRLGAEDTTDDVGRWLRDRLEDDADVAYAIPPVEPEEIADALAQEPRIVFASELLYLTAEDDACDFYQQGVDRLNEGRFNDAVAAFAQAIDLDPAHAYAYNDLAAAYMLQGQWEEPVPWLEKATRLKPDYVDAHNNLGMSLMNLRRYEAAIHAFQNAVALQPDLAQACHHLAVCFGYLGDLGEVVAWNRRAVEAAPDFRDAHHHLGWAFMSQGEEEEAMACFEKTIALDPDFFPAYGNLGALYLGQRAYGEAVPYLLRAVALNPDYAHAHMNLFIAYLRMGAHEEAQSHFERVYTLQEGLLRAPHYVLLGEACMTLDEYAKAIFWYQKARALQPASEAAREGLEAACREYRWQRLDAQSEQTLEPGALVIGNLISLRDDGAIVSVEGLLFMVTADDMLDEPGADPREVFRQGQQVEACILTYIPGVGGSVRLR